MEKSIIAKQSRKLTQNRRKIFRFSFALILFSVSFALGEAAQAASLYLSPSSGAYNIGQTFSVTVFVSSADQAMNATSGVIAFPQDKLQITSLSKSGSIMSLWVQEPSFSNATGTVNFEGVVLNPGFTGSGGKIASINFKVKAKGSGAVSFASGSVLANDGKGTNILAGMAGANYVFSEGGESEGEYVPPPAATGVPLSPVISSSTHPDPEKWYSNNDPEFAWKLPVGVTGVSFLFDEKPTSNPGNVSDGQPESKNYENIEDGIWYFHIKFKNQYGWGKITHRKVLIDTKAPEPFEITIDNGGDSTNPSPILNFKTFDSLSGIDYYEIKFGDGDNLVASLAYLEHNPYKVPAQAPGEHSVVVTAFDKAKNSVSAGAKIAVLPLEAPVIEKWSKRINVGGSLILEGKSPTNVSVLIFWKKRGEEAVMAETKADEQGKWEFASSGLETGDYGVWAQSQDKRGSLSLPSEKKDFGVGLPPFLKFGRIAIDYLTVMITLIVLIIGALAVIFYAWYRLSVWRKKMRKETKEVEENVEKAFQALREEIQEQIELLDQKPGLTKAEKKIRDKLREALDVSEEFIKKELKDIEKELE